jgi:hypothetical protein
MPAETVVEKVRRLIGKNRHIAGSGGLEHFDFAEDCAEWVRLLGGKEKDADVIRPDRLKGEDLDLIDVQRAFPGTLKLEYPPSGEKATPPTSAVRPSAKESTISGVVISSAGAQ